MKIVKQFGIILSVTLAGEGLNYIIPLPIPASIYGMAIMLACLCLKIIKVSDVKETADFLLETMPIMFIPAAAGLITTMDILENNFLAYAVAAVISTLIVMAVSGGVAQIIIKRKGGEK